MAERPTFDFSLSSPVDKLSPDAPEIPVRVCTRCNQAYPLKDIATFFHKDAKSPTGYHTSCKLCRKRREDEERTLRVGQAALVTKAATTLIGDMLDRGGKKQITGIAELGATMIEVFGGEDEHVRMLKAEFDAMMPGSFGRTKILEMIRQTVAKASEINSANKTTLETISDQELAERLADRIRKQNAKEAVENPHLTTTFTVHEDDSDSSAGFDEEDDG